MANNSFFKFLLGFIVIISAALAVALISQSKSNGAGGVLDLIANFFR